VYEHVGLARPYIATGTAVLLDKSNHMLPIGRRRQMYNPVGDMAVRELTSMSAQR
jgi:hypothetical protein